MAPAVAQEKLYTIDDIYSLPEGSRAELIDGQIYYIAPPKLYSGKKRLLRGFSRSLCRLPVCRRFQISGTGYIRNLRQRQIK